MSEDLKITKQRVLEAAANCSAAKETLKTLFPEIFEEPIFQVENRTSPGKITDSKNRPVVEISGFPDINQNHLCLNHHAFDFDIVDLKGGKYLKVTPKQK